MISSLTFPMVFSCIGFFLVGFIGAYLVDVICIELLFWSPFDELEKGFSGNGLDPDASFSNEIKEGTKGKDTSENTEELNTFSGQLLFVAVCLVSFLLKVW